MVVLWNDSFPNRRNLGRLEARMQPGVLGSDLVGLVKLMIPPNVDVMLEVMSALSKPLEFSLVVSSTSEAGPSVSGFLRAKHQVVGVLVGILPRQQHRVLGLHRNPLSCDLKPWSDLDSARLVNEACRNNFWIVFPW